MHGNKQMHTHTLAHHSTNSSRHNRHHISTSSQKHITRIHRIIHRDHITAPPYHTTKSHHHIPRTAPHITHLHQHIKASPHGAHHQMTSPDITPVAHHSTSIAAATPGWELGQVQSAKALPTGSQRLDHTHRGLYPRTKKSGAA